MRSVRNSSSGDTARDELGHTFKLGTKYTAPDSMDVTYLDSSGEPNLVVMGCYGIGVERLMASVIERWHDDSGIDSPYTAAPFHIVISQLGKKPEIVGNGRTDIL